jgi:Zn-dependent peptidase ImmA (M78 family)
MSTEATVPVLDELRAVVPRRGLSPAEAVAVAELQAAKLLRAADITAPPVPIEEVAIELLGIRVVRRANWPGSGLALTVKDGWVVALRAEEAPVRQRFSLAHECKHILDDSHIEWLYPCRNGRWSEEWIEAVCNRFAANLLMPRAWVKADWASRGIQDIGRLARRYHVSWTAMDYRLDQLGLRMPRPRCGRIRRIGVAA